METETKQAALKSPTWPFFQRIANKVEAWSRLQQVAFLSLLQLVLIGGPYYAANLVSRWRDTTTFNVQTPFEETVPFIAWTLVFYVSFYLYFIIIAWMASLNPQRRKEGWVLLQCMTMISLSTMVFWMVFPVRIDLRHQISDVGPLYDTVMGLLHTVDAPYNAWPSVHVLYSTLIVLMVRYWMKESQTWKGLFSLTIVVCWALLVISTVTIKQHYLFDIVTGLFFSIVPWYVWVVPRLAELKEAP